MATQTADGTSQSSSQNVFGVVSDAATGAMFSLLHAFDPDPIQDSSKNLRVLWVRALLHQRGKIDDPVAELLLPPTTRGLVTSEAGARLFDPILKFTEWIQARTDFIDAGVEHFLSSPACRDAKTGDARRCNVVLFGAGYDTRALRFRNSHNGKINFFEVDLPDICQGKRTLYDKFQADHDPDMEKNASTFVPLDLNSCGDEQGSGLMKTIRASGLDSSLPTFFVFEAVLFYVNEDAVRNIAKELFDVARNPTAGETMLCFTDSLKPFVDVPFTNEARAFFDQNDMELLEHRSRWGGAVHFCLAASRNVETKKPGAIAGHVSSRVGGIVNSYTPTQSNNPVLLKNPSFDKVWYAVAYPWQIDGYETPLDAVLGHKKKSSSNKPFATRLWGEPIIIYRDAANELVAMADVCPHRSVPLSMGKINDQQQLVCLYHGWKFGKGGDCVDVPTLRTINDETGEVLAETGASKFLQRVTRANCGNLRAVVEHEGIVYVWRGNVLEADPSLLPTRRKGDMETVPIDTVLDYSVDYSYIIENNLDSPHLFYLHDGSVPPIESIGMMNKNLPKLKLTAFVDDCGMGHLGRLEGTRPKKLLRFDPPNIVRHGGVSGFEEEFHIIPIAHQRTRVLLRQHLPRGPILSTITSFPFVLPFLTLLVNNWNYHIALEDSNVMQGQANRIEDWGSPRMGLGGLGDDLIKRYWRWRSKAHDALVDSGYEVASPYYVDFAHHDSRSVPAGIPSGTSFGDAPSVVERVRGDSRLTNIPLVSDNNEVDPTTGKAIGTYGIKEDYLQETPEARFPPINYKQYARMLVFDDLVKNLFLEKDCTEVAPDLEEIPSIVPSLTNATVPA